MAWCDAFRYTACSVLTASAPTGWVGVRRSSSQRLGESEPVAGPGRPAVSRCKRRGRPDRTSPWALSLGFWKTLKQLNVTLHLAEKKRSSTQVWCYNIFLWHSRPVGVALLANKDFQVVEEAGEAWLQAELQVVFPDHQHQHGHEQTQEAEGEAHRALATLFRAEVVSHQTVKTLSEGDGLNEKQFSSIPIASIWVGLIHELVLPLTCISITTIYDSATVTSCFIAFDN